MGPAQTKYYHLRRPISEQVRWGLCDTDPTGGAATWRGTGDTHPIVAPSLPQDQLHFLYPPNDTRRHYCNPVKLEEEEKGIANWGKPNRGLIIAATDLDRGDITTAFDTGRPKVTNSSV